MFIHSSVDLDHLSSLQSLSFSLPLYHSLTRSLVPSPLNMSSLSFLSVYLAAASLIVLVTAVSAQYDEFTPDYGDYNSTIEYTFFSNASNDDLDKLSERFIGRDDKDTGGLQEEVTVTMDSQRTTEGAMVDIHGAASRPVSMDIRMLVWTLVVLISLNTL